MQKANTVAETFNFFLTNAPTPRNKPARTLKVRAGLPPNIYTIRMAAVYASLFHYFSRGTESLCGTVSYMGFEKFAGWTGMFTPDCPAIPKDRLGVIPGNRHARFITSAQCRFCKQSV